MLLILAALVAVVLVGCGPGNSSQGQENRQASRTAGSPEKTASQSTGSSQQKAGGRLGHPALGSADAPVILTEFSDYQ